MSLMPLAIFSTFAARPAKATTSAMVGLFDCRGEGGEDTHQVVAEDTHQSVAKDALAEDKQSKGNHSGCREGNQAGCKCREGTHQAVAEDSLHQEGVLYNLLERSLSLLVHLAADLLLAKEFAYLITVDYDLHISVETAVVHCGGHEWVWTLFFARHRYLLRGPPPIFDPRHCLDP
ncbi:hypothetical protein SUGI_0791520 [Cryptomeria japonica]|nr:hypothetical protein SUGI_0791520 [Cryptomeria japonica]